ncbi:MAG: decaprenyl-phosphate phosphoribosyltransferase [Actinomycetota bacterium]|nr:decaprenyl-phosphate phosphoribosyltransferase [Actinomycetota bacterium]
MLRDVTPSSGATSRPTARQSLAFLLRAMRPKQWLKNLLVFAAAGAGGTLLSGSVLLRTGLAFISFSLVSSAAYLFNDVRDREADRRHPEKCMRPIASGELPVGVALSVALLLLVAGSVIGLPLGAGFLIVVALYVAISGAYSLGLKHVPVLEIGLIVTGFVLRAVGGSAAAGVHLSKWFVILTSFGALFVVAGKRFAECRLFGEGEAGSRTSLESYTLMYLRFVYMMAAAVAVVAYCLWSFDQPHLWRSVPWSELSAIPFVLSVLRYALVLETGQGAAPEDIVLRDRPLQGMVLAWLIVYAAGVWLVH